MLVPPRDEVALVGDHAVRHYRHAIRHRCLCNAKPRLRGCRGATERSRHCQARLRIGWGEFFPSIKGASDNAAAADLIASAIDTELPKAPSSVHLLLRDKASWVEPQIGPNDDCFDGYPALSIEDWHKKHKLWIE